MSFFASRSRRILGTPTEEVWPDVQKLPDFKSTFPRWSKQDLGQLIQKHNPEQWQQLGAEGLDLLQVRSGAMRFSRLISRLLANPHVRPFEADIR
jgi:hypothetical protein